MADLFGDWVPDISIHAPRTGSDSWQKLRLRRRRRFQSTLPARGATILVHEIRFVINHFNPRSPHGERPIAERETSVATDFNPRSPHGERLHRLSDGWSGWTISIHAPRTGSDAVNLPGLQRSDISIHAPRTGSDFKNLLLFRNVEISIHAPRTGSDGMHRRKSFCRCHFNPRSPHGERRYEAMTAEQREISIHAPRTGSDQSALKRWKGARNFNPRSPHGERRAARGWEHEQHGDFNPRSPHGERPSPTDVNTGFLSFQSTLPARGATSGGRYKIKAPDNFNPRSPHGERHPERGIRRSRIISIHAPRTGSDCRRQELRVFVAISIHAPRTGSDEQNSSGSYTACLYFNPRSPHGERRYSFWLEKELEKFQSTLPARGATAAAAVLLAHIVFQSTLPARGATACEAVQVAAMCIFQSTLPARGATAQDGDTLYTVPHFNPRSPHGERRRDWPGYCRARHISIHAPRTGSDVSASPLATLTKKFQSTLPARGATPHGATCHSTHGFQSTLPARGATV